jgi:predicted helicase
MSAPDNDSEIEWLLDDLVNLLSKADIGAILQDFGKRTRQEDPVVHFYETFLAAYDPKMKEARGVYYTPEPIVSYIVRSVDALLKSDFGLSDGLSDATEIQQKLPNGGTLKTHQVQILDPATGTGTFLHSVVDFIYENYFVGNQGMWSGYVRDHLLSRMYAFELLMAPYTIAHLKLSLQLQELKADLSGVKRLNIFLTNALEEGFESGASLLAGKLRDEADAASHVKYDAPVMVVLGNPPYSGHSANTSQWINDLLRGNIEGKRNPALESYFEVDGQPLGEKNPKWLNDDYVKFIRFAQ